MEVTEFVRSDSTKWKLNSMFKKKKEDFLH